MAKLVEDMRKEIRSIEFWRAAGAEVVATFILMAVQAALPLSWPGAPSDPVRIALGMGFVLIMLIETFGHISGAHMNPAVSIAMAVAFKITPLRALTYVIAQVCGALAGAGFIYGVTADVARGALAATTVNPLITPAQGFFVETFLTFMLVSVIFGATDDDLRKVYMPSIPIGITLGMSILAGITYTGASLNPARSFGPAVVAGIWEHHWVYWAGPIIGGLVAALLYRYILTLKQRREKAPETKQSPEYDSETVKTVLMALIQKFDNEQNGNHEKRESFRMAENDKSVNGGQDNRGFQAV